MDPEIVKQAEEAKLKQAEEFLDKQSKLYNFQIKYGRNFGGRQLELAVYQRKDRVAAAYITYDKIINSSDAGASLIKQWLDSAMEVIENDGR